MTKTSSSGADTAANTATDTAADTAADTALSLQESNTPNAMPTLRRRPGPLQRTLASLRRSPVGMIGGLIIGVVLFCALFGPAITPHDPVQHNLRARFEAPGFTDENGTYWLGTDQLGRDILRVKHVIVGSRVSVVVGVATVAIAGVIGILYGIVAGFAGGWVDALLIRVADGLLAIPFIILAVAVSGVIGPSLTTLILVLGFTGWVSYTR